jgi:glycine/D-amino acid oxidase-like deaminating enzyme
MNGCHHVARTYKLAIKFRGWSEPGIDFYHPFERLPVVDGFTLADWWISMGGVDDFGRSVFLAAALCDGVRSPRHLDGSLVADLGRDDSLSRSTPDDETVQYPYGYHFDATHLAKLLARHGIGQGVEHIVDEIAHVRLDARGWISHLVGSSGRHFDADLYVDCTGFRGVLVNGALHEPFISFADTLPNDRAVVCRVPRGGPVDHSALHHRNRGRGRLDLVHPPLRRDQRRLRVLVPLQLRG